MNRLVALKVVLGLVGVLFLVMAWPLVAFLREEPALSMMMSLYVTLGVFLLLAIRNPSGSRSVIAFAACSSLAHAVVMGTQVMRGMVQRREMIGVVVFVLIGIVFIVLAPPKQLGNTVANG